MMIKKMIEKKCNKDYKNPFCKNKNFIYTLKDLEHCGF